MTSIVHVIDDMKSSVCRCFEGMFASVLCTPSKLPHQQPTSQSLKQPSKTKHSKRLPERQPAAPAVGVRLVLPQISYERD